MATNPTRTTVVGVFESREPAEQAIDALQRAGFRPDQIGFAMRGGGDVPAGAVDTVEGSNAGAGAATGAILGSLLGAAAALLIPGIGPVLAIGTLGGAVLTGAVAGGALGALAGALIGMGVPEEEANYYQGEFESGRAVVTVKAESRAGEAEKILRSLGAYDVNSRQPVDSARGGAHEHLHAHAGGTDMHSHTHEHPAGQPEQHDHSHAAAGMASASTDRSAVAADRTSMAADRTSKPADRTPMAADRARTESADTLELREERLDVNKERVQTGQVEIGKRVVEERKTMEVPVTREEVVIERRPVNRPSDEPIGEDARTIDVPVAEERVSVEKQTVVREEIGAQKRVEQATVPVEATVRREEAVINRTGEAGVAGRGPDWTSQVPSFRQHWQSNYGSRGPWEQYEPMYRYGYDQFTGGRWSGRSWSEVEPELRRDWSSSHPDQAWDVASNPIKHAWDHLMGSPHTHTR